jgi:hypothetical protein
VRRAALIGGGILLALVVLSVAVVIAANIGIDVVL